MAKIEDVQRTVSDFLRKTLHTKNVKVIREAKVNGEWEAEAEVYEESSFIKSLGINSRVMDRHIYIVRLDDALEVVSYTLKEKD